MFTVSNDTVTKPTRKTKGSAGFDLVAHSIKKVELTSNRGRIVIGFGVSVDIPEGHVGLLTLRSSVAMELGIAPVNGVGIIDEDYTGELMMVFNSAGLGDRLHKLVESKVRLAQLVIVPYVTDGVGVDINRTGGFGSTGK